MTSTPEPLRAFVDGVERLRRRDLDDQALAQAVAERLGVLLSSDGWLSPEHRQPSRQSYRQNIVHVAPDGGFSVVCLVWQPGQRTPIHDHVAWCVVGVMQGQEEETRYGLFRADGEEFLVEQGRHVHPAGDIVALVPPAENIHRVTNTGQETALSIHVYGADIQALGSSINRTFDDLEVRPSAAGAEPVAWRLMRETRHRIYETEA